jgi:enediyne biosynthesis protein E3
LENATVIAASGIGAPAAPSWTHYSTLPFRHLLRLSLKQASFERRGFFCLDPSAQSALEAIGRVFIGGYNEAITARDTGIVLRHISAISPAERGFAVEGASMGAAVADSLPFRQTLLLACIEAFKSDFLYLIHVGAGWALARVPWRRRQILASLDPLHRWLAFDGLGFHDTYFYHRHILAGWRREPDGYNARAYDQGVGRALWFVASGSATAAVEMISALPAARHPDLWAGLGLAMAYAGPLHRNRMAVVVQMAGANWTHFAQGVAFACEARVLARHVPVHTHLTAVAVWDLGAEEVAGLVRAARDRLPATDGDPPRYELWRRSVADAFSPTAGQLR